ncbi:2'-5' RNA ligase family protein [Rhizobacter sp. P5_C2]
MTLHFLGDVDLIDEASLVEALAAVPVPELQLSIRSTAIWHDGVVVLLAEGTPALDDLRRDTGVAVAAAGLESEPRWTPHMTLAGTQARHRRRHRSIRSSGRRAKCLWSGRGVTPRATRWCEPGRRSRAEETGGGSDVVQVAIFGLQARVACDPRAWRGSLLSR